MTRAEYENFIAFTQDGCRFAYPGNPPCPQRGNIIGEAELVDCVREHASPWFVGKYGFVLSNAKPLPFRPLKAISVFSSSNRRGTNIAKDELTKRQVEVLTAAHKSSNGWIERGFSRIWGIAPMAVHALVKKGYLEMPHGRGRARLTRAGRTLIERRQPGTSPRNYREKWPVLPPCRARRA